MSGLYDSFQRPINYLRVSVTDRCNLRCVYCMPPEGVALLRHEDILTYEEITAIVQAASELGINKVRLTGGEPLARLGLPKLVKMLSAIRGIDDISLTTNGTLLAKYAGELKEAGLRRVNISLDTLRPERFSAITRGSSHLEEVLAGIKAAESAGLLPVKLNMVVVPGTNDDELLDFAGKTVTDGWHVRFIEHMPVNGTGARPLTTSQIKERLNPLGKMEPVRRTVGNGPARYFRLPGAKGTLGFITPVSEHFCFQCNRLRLTADGKLRPCLLADEEIDLKQSLAKGISMEELKKLIQTAAARKPHQHHLSRGYTMKGRPFSQVGG